MKPAGDDQRGDATDDACYLGQPNQLVIRRCWHGRDPGPVEAVVASPRQLVKIGTSIHSSTVPRLIATFQS